MKILLALVPLFFGTLVLLLLCDFDIEALKSVLTFLTPFDWHDIGVVLYCGAIIGWERMVRNKVLGMRTSIFIILGTYLFTAISMAVASDNSVADATRVIGQIVSGIGFLGAGVMFNRENKVTGLTSAATIWMLAALGVCIGVGYLHTAVIIATLSVVLLIVINEVDDAFVDLTKTLAAKYEPKYCVKEDYDVHTGQSFYIATKTSRFGFWKKLNGVIYDKRDMAETALRIMLRDSKIVHK